jgi:hypothetical protein
MSGMMGKLADPLGVVIKDKKSSAPAAPAPTEKSDTDKAKTEQMALREQQRGQAAAGMVLGSDNEADQLGSTGKRRASRTLLGG